jgi:hypothetical protein
MQSFEHTPPEARELLSRPIRDLGLELEGSMLEKQHERDRAVVLADVPDSELEDIFVRRGEDLKPAGAFLLEHRKVIVDKITYWTGVRRTVIEVVAFATTLAMNYLTRGGFTER